MLIRFIRRQGQPHVYSSQAMITHRFLEERYDGTFLNTRTIAGLAHSSQIIDNDNRILSVKRLVSHLKGSLLAHVLNNREQVIKIPLVLAENTIGAIINGLPVPFVVWHRNFGARIGKISLTQ